jgi:hypothetical protein
MISNPILEAFNIDVSMISVTPKGTVYLSDTKKTFGKIMLSDNHIKLVVGEVETGTPNIRVFG